MKIDISHNNLSWWSVKASNVKEKFSVNKGCDLSVTAFTLNEVFQKEKQKYIRPSSGSVCYHPKVTL